MVVRGNDNDVEAKLESDKEHTNDENDNDNANKETAGRTITYTLASASHPSGFISSTTWPRSPLPHPRTNRLLILV